jgi:hypothetical protein
VLVAFAVAVLLAGCARPLQQTTSPSQTQFVFDDVHNFVRAYRQLATSTDSVAVLDSLYLRAASPGLKLFREKYPFDAKALSAAIAQFPADYAGVEQRLQWMLGQRDSLRALIGTFGKHVPILAPLPVYFLVGKHSGTASGSAVGALITIENGAVNPVRSNLPEFLIHEFTHIQQFSAIGMDRYQTIFGPRKSLLALTIREGIAEFVADLITGRITQQRARAYLEANADDVWRRFRAEMCGVETGDWMWVRPKDPAQPSFVGYALGAEIARAFYENQRDKRAAIRTLLYVDDYPRFLRESKYALARGDLESEIAPILKSCPN